MSRFRWIDRHIVNRHVVIGVIVALFFSGGLFLVLRSGADDSEPLGAQVGDQGGDQSSRSDRSDGSPDSTATPSAGPVGPRGTNGADGGAQGPNGTKVADKKDDSKVSDGNRSTGSGGSQGSNGSGGTTAPEHRTVRLAGVTLDNLFPRESIRDLTVGTLLGTSRYCGFLVNLTDRPTTVGAITLTAEAGRVVLDHSCNSPEYQGLWEPFDEVTVDPSQAPECAAGVKLVPGSGCFVGIVMAEQPEFISKGSLTISSRTVCTSSESATCAVVAEDTPTVSRPVDILRSVTFAFDIAARPGSDNQPSPGSSG